MDEVKALSTKIAFIILAHENIEKVKKLTNTLLNEDEECYVFIHFDKKSSREKFIYLQNVFASEHRCIVLENNLKCSWGGYGLVDATLRLLHAATRTTKFDYFYLLSESCYPIRPIKDLKNYLATSNSQSFIEVESSQWIHAGMRDDRYKYRHYLNFKKHPNLFRRIYRFQRFFKLVKKMPREIEEIKFGSQWWCLHSSMVEKMLMFLHHHQDYKRFFKSTWIPDECFFQTLCWHLDRKRLNTYTLTHYEFDQKGKPKIYESTKGLDKVYVDKYFVRKLI